MLKKKEPFHLKLEFLDSHERKEIDVTLLGQKISLDKSNIEHKAPNSKKPKVLKYIHSFKDIPVQSDKNIFTIMVVEVGRESESSRYLLPVFVTIDS